MTIYTGANKTCIASDCDSVATRRGMCQKHYDAAHRGSVVTVKSGHELPTFNHVKCRIDGCARMSRARGMCEYHYNKTKRKSDTPCSVQGCIGHANSAGYCLNHYRRYRRYGNPLGGAARDGRSKMWHADHHGYIVKYEPSNPHALPNGKVSQHRFVLGEHIGRPLRKDENVHHKNGNRADNRIENLELWSKSQPSGQRVVDKVKWAKEILAEYGDLDIL